MNLPFGYYMDKSPPYWDALFTVYFGPSKSYTQICFALHKRGIHIHNNIGGQLGPRRLSIHLWWHPLKLSWRSTPYP